jgi:hypothetical protein
LLASIHIWNDWDWKAAEEELNIAAALEPNNPGINDSFCDIWILFVT